MGWKITKHNVQSNHQFQNDHHLVSKNNIILQDLVIYTYYFSLVFSKRRSNFIVTLEKAHFNINGRTLASLVLFPISYYTSSYLISNHIKRIRTNEIWIWKWFGVSQVMLWVVSLSVLQSSSKMNKKNNKEIARLES